MRRSAVAVVAGVKARCDGFARARESASAVCAEAVINKRAHAMEREPPRSINKIFCDHCKEFVGRSTYYRHQARYYDQRAPAVESLCIFL